MSKSNMGTDRYRIRT